MPRASNQGIYRNADDAVRSRREEARARWHEQLVALQPRLVEVYAQRVGRIAFGMIGLVGFGVLILASAYGTEAQAPTRTLGLIWLAMISGYLSARWSAVRHAWRELGRPEIPSFDLWRDLDRLENDTPAALIRRLEGDLARSVYRWTGHFPERTRALLRHLAARADDQTLIYDQDREPAAVVALTALVTTLALTHVRTGRYIP